MDPAERESSEVEIRALAARGRLAEAIRHSPDSKDQLFMLVSSLVYERLTCPAERMRGHHACASGISRLEPDCHDRFEDDVFAVWEYLLRHADQEFDNIGGWLASRLRAISIDAHRMRRSQLGAAARPRIPRWLAIELGEDPWLEKLAVDILTWVGVRAVPSEGIWPLSAWANRRMELRGEFRDEQTVAADVETVLAAMRTHPTWYQRFVETPLGRKQPPVAADGGEHTALMLTERDADESMLIELAALAVDAITRRTSRGEDPRTVVSEVIDACFGQGALDTGPSAGPTAELHFDRVAAALDDEDAKERLVDRILAAVNEVAPRKTG